MEYKNQIDLTSAIIKYYEEGKLDCLINEELFELMEKDKREKPCLNLKSKFFDNRSHIADMFDFGKKYN